MSLLCIELISTAMQETSLIIHIGVAIGVTSEKARDISNKFQARIGCGRRRYDQCGPET